MTYVIVNGCLSLPVVLMYDSLFDFYNLLCRFLRIQWQTSHNHLHILVWFTVSTQAAQSTFSPHVNIHSKISAYDGCAYMQCPAVRTQQLSMRTPPHKCLNCWLLFFGLTCKDTCQGIAPGLTFRPPKIRFTDFLGSGFPQVENCFDGAVVLTGTLVGAEEVGEASLGFTVIEGLVVISLGTVVGLIGVGSVWRSVVAGSEGTISVGATPANKPKCITEDDNFLTELIMGTFSETLKLTCRFRTFCHITVVPEQPAASSVETPGHPVAIWISVLVCT